MSNTVKTKFAGLLRGLLRRLDDNEAPATPTRASSPARVPDGRHPGCRRRSARRSRRRAMPSTPVVRRTPRAGGQSRRIATAAATHPGLVDDGFARQNHADTAAGTMISIPLEKILTQLAFGSVKINFGELRHAAPGVFVNSGGEHDHKPVTLPLNEILTRLNPARFHAGPRKSMLKWPRKSPGHLGRRPGSQNFHRPPNPRRPPP